MPGRRGDSNKNRVTQSNPTWVIGGEEVGQDMQVSLADRGGTKDRRFATTTELQREALAVRSEVWALSPDVGSANG
jgi:hypothetical protein